MISVMKKLTPWYAWLLTLLFVSNISFADQQQIPQIHVIGNATTKVTPDLINWSIRVNNQGVQLNDVAKQHQNIVSNALNLIKQFAINEQSLQTTNMTFGEKTKYQQNNRVHDGYFANTQISFSLLNTDQYQKLWMKLSAIPEVSISSVNYDSSKKEQLQASTRLAALQNAKQKASAMAAELNSSLGEPLTIAEMGTNNGAHPPMLASAKFSTEMADNSSSLETGQLTITMQVSVSFMLHSQVNFQHPTSEN